MTPSVLLKVAVLLVLLALGGIIGVSCVPERHEPVPGPPTPQAVRPEPVPRDLAGHERDARRGITPGALEAEAPTPEPTERN